MDKNIVLWIIAVAVIAVGAFYYFNDPATEEDPGVPDTNEPAQGENIVLESPLPGERVFSPINIRGEARLWYFEAQFGVRLERADGSLITEHFATAEGDWMTEDFVPFTSEVSFNVDEETPANLILQKSNPSGLPELDKSLSIPLILLPSDDGEADETISLDIFFSAPGGDDCSLVEAVTRRVPQTRAVAHAAIRELLKGPTETEKTSGLSSGIPEDVMLNGIRIDEGVAYADFSEELNRAAGSCLVTSIRSQIERTLLQFDTVDRVEISVDGDTKEVLQP